MKKYSQMLLGVIVGASFAITLTIEFWGVAWYQVAIAFLLGSIIGMFIADYQETKQVLLSAVSKTISSISNFGDDIKYFEPEPEYFIKGFMSVIIILVAAGYLFQLHGWPVMPDAQSSWDIVMFLGFVVIGFITIISLLFSSSPKFWYIHLGVGKLNNRFSEVYNVSFSAIGDPSPVMSELTKPYSYWTGVRKVLATWAQVWLVFELKMVLGFFMLTLGLALTVIVFPLWFLQAIGKTTTSLIVSTSIAIGLVVAVLFFNSWPLGLYVGVSTSILAFGIFVIISQYFKIKYFSWYKPVAWFYKQTFTVFPN